MVQKTCFTVPLETCGRVVALLDTIKCLAYIGAYIYVLYIVPQIVDELQIDDEEEFLLVTKSVYIVLYIGIVSNLAVILAAAVLFGGLYWSSYKLAYPWIILNFSNLLYFIIILILIYKTPEQKLRQFKNSGPCFGYVMTIVFTIFTSFKTIKMTELLRSREIVAVP